MTDDIVTRQEQEIDFVEYLRLWASPDGNDQAVRDLHKAADEIERLRADRDRWVKWGEHVFTCPNKGLNPCRDCVSPATADAISRVNRGEAWHV